MKMLFNSLYLTVVFACQIITRLTLAWNFSDLHLPQDVLIWRFAIWRNRAYLAIPRWDIKQAKIPFTLLEAPWPEAGIPLQFGVPIPEVLPFPNARSQEEGICENLQSVTGLDTDSRGRLWILDSPTRADSRCTPKIMIFDLRKNEKIAEIKLKGISPRDLKCLVVDPVIGQRGIQAYVTDPGDETIIVYNPAQKTWWKLKLTREYYIPKIFSTDLAIDRKNSIMYITGYPSHDLFSIDLDNVRNEDGPFHQLRNNLTRSANISWVGSKLGSSSGLICDYRGGLHYFMLSEIASVRWDSRQKLEAEGHSVLLQSEIVPSITDYALDLQKNVWAIVNPKHPLRNEIKSKKNKIIRRTIKVYKFNPFAL